jgi:phosphoribosyl 1,2-cyclic phosphodiesterase
MSLFVASLNSGSNGNCYYVGNHEEAVLIDAGISCKETEVRMKRLGLSFNKLRAIFISHEHADHINGVATLSKKYQLPVYITPETRRNGRVSVKDHLSFSFKAYEPVTIGALSVLPFPKEHDAADPHSFVITHNQVNVGVFTDIGSVCDRVIAQFKKCHAVILESNYDEDMLERGRYSQFLKERIRGGKGHISNAQALELFLAHRPEFMSHLFLGHLSAENNSQKIVKKIFSEVAGKTEVIVASRNKETTLYHIRNKNHSMRKMQAAQTAQLALF